MIYKINQNPYIDNCLSISYISSIIKFNNQQSIGGIDIVINDWMIICISDVKWTMRIGSVIYNCMIEKEIDIRIVWVYITGKRRLTLVKIFYAFAGQVALSKACLLINAIVRYL